MMTSILIIFIILFILVFGYLKAPFWIWLIVLPAFGFLLISEGAALVILGGLLLFIITPLRRYIISFPAIKIMKKILPPISKTEKVALDAGVVWIESGLFSGVCDFEAWSKFEKPKLTEEEQKFLNHETEELCRKIDDWKIWKDRDIDLEVFEDLRKKKFFSMIIPKKYGGLEFSPYAHARVIEKISSRSLVVGVTVMVPNSLGPAELLVHYGTEKQKDYYLPRLASGDDIPCFGLTELKAGSDAGSLRSEGILYKRDDGKIGIRINWNKRWITLSGVATLVGLAFNLKDPDHLLSDKENIGISVGLIPADTPGVKRGLRHDPMGIPFNNCPIEGKDVEVLAEEVLIGGLDRAGQGWEMLMSCLGMGRGISLPSQSVSGLKLSHLVTSAYSVVRKQFGVSIGQFEGIKEQLSYIGASNYWTESSRLFTLRALVDGISPPVITAIVKYHSTETSRIGIIKAMDILAGKAISMGPRNPLALPYIGSPIGITVEGANILTRTLMIFGQGLLRAHPYAYQEVKAVEENDLKKFDKVFYGHIVHILSTICRSAVLTFSRGWLYFYKAPKGTLRYYQKIAWATSNFALLADMAMALLGGKLKFKEKITGQFADILSWLYICHAVLWRYRQDGCRKEDLPYVDYACQLSLYRVQRGFDILLKNFKVPYFSWVFRILYDFSRLNQISGRPSGEVENKLCDMMIDVESRKRMTDGIFIPDNDSFHLLEKAFLALQEVEPSRQKLKTLVKKGLIPRKMKRREQLKKALELEALTQQEIDKMLEAEDLRDQAIGVDSFTEEEYHA